jgi:hypothetical protein
VRVALVRTQTFPSSSARAACLCAGAVVRKLLALTNDRCMPPPMLATLLPPTAIGAGGLKARRPCRWSRPPLPRAPPS